MAIIAIDFDGTIVEHRYPDIGRMRLHVDRVIRRIKEAGHEIIIWTCRTLEEDIESMKNFLIKNDIPFSRINENSNLVTFGCVPKIYYNIIIDDRALFYRDDWLEIEKELERIGVL